MVEENETQPKVSKEIN